MKFLLTVVSILTLAASPMALAQRSTIAFETIMDDSGVLADADDAEQHKLLMLGHLKSLNRFRRFSTARIDIISTSYGRSMWIGSPSDLNSPRAGELLDYTKPHPDHCNNLQGAFKALGANLEQLDRQGYEEIHILVFSSLIDTPRPCDGSIDIQLPQLPPPLDINAILESSDAVKSINFYWISPHQRAVWNEFLAPSIEHAAQNSIPFGLFDIENTRFELEEGLQGVLR